MSAAARICPHCGVANDAQATFCGACASQIASTSRALVRVQPKPLAVRLTAQEKATLGSVAVGVVALAVRVGTALLARREAAAPARAIEPSAPPAPGHVRVRRRWVTGDQTGPQQWGEEEIEIEQNPEDRSTVRLWLGRR